MRIFAIGATGFIGPHVVRQLANAGHDVAAFSRGGRVPFEHERVTAIQGDRDRIADYRRDIEAFAPDAVLDFVAYTETQMRALVNLLEGISPRVVVLSSCDVYRNYDGLTGRWTGPHDVTPLTEIAPTREYLYPYRGNDALERFKYRDDYEKLLVERAATNGRSVRATILRLPAVFGPADNQQRLHPYLQLMEAGESEIRIAPARSRWRWTRGYVENVARAILCATVNPKAIDRTYNIGDSPTLTEREWIEKIAKAADWKGNVIIDDDGEDASPWEYSLEIDTSRIRDSLDFCEIVGWEQALEKTIQWSRENGG